MPIAPSRSRRDSWPPLQIRMNQAISGSDASPNDIDEDPLTYFLTPAPLLDDADSDEEMMDFDAGIEDPNHPQEIIRSISPSSLDGRGRRKTRKASPEPELSDGMTPDEDDDEEYVRFRPLGLPFGLGDFAIDGIKKKPSSITGAAIGPAGGNHTSNTLLPPSPYHHSPVRGRTSSLGHGARGLSSRNRPQHLWREPSPDVWSIEEEAEVEDSISRAPGDEAGTTKEAIDKKTNLEVSAAKPKKKVRFVLPVKD